MLASDVNNAEFMGAQDPDSVMIARFYKKAVKQEFESQKQGRPIFIDVIYCEYWAAGDTKSRMDRPAHEDHKQRFSKQWAYYERTQGGDSMEIGTPLSQWAILSPADVENLKGAKFLTIEHIAGSSDLQLQALGMGVAGLAPHVLRARAQAYLGAAQDTALPQKQAQDIANLQKQVEQLTALLTAKPAATEPQVLAAPQAAKKDGRSKPWTEEQKQAARDRLAKARASKKVKQDGLNTTATG